MSNDLSSQPYEVLDHTADIGIRIFGGGLVELFTRAGRALFEQITETGQLNPGNRIDIMVSGSDWPDLMVNWLRELLFLWTGRDLLVTDLNIDKIDEFYLAATVSTEPYNQNHHVILNEIKAVTYHQIEVQQKAQGWQAVVIFDI